MQNIINHLPGYKASFLIKSFVKHWMFVCFTYVQDASSFRHMAGDTLTLLYTHFRWRLENIKL